MALLILEVAAPSLAAILPALETTLGECPTTSASLSGIRDSSLAFEALHDRWEAEYHRLQSGELIAMRVEPVDCSVVSAMVLSPEFDGSGPTWWTLLVEFMGQGAGLLFEKLLSVPDTFHVVLSLEESLEWETSEPPQISFPWDDPQIVKAGVRTPAGWIVRDGRLAHLMKVDRKNGF